ncbi:MAG: hypothetical protein HY934_11170 [Candidatus Firestonebacteria bacterium]|nr:hypothetical protein [Candidatus Firestonebacteria bacterium]
MKVNKFKGGIKMSYSKLSADGAMLDLKAIIISIWELANFFQTKDKDSAKKRLDNIKKDIEILKEDAGTMEENLRFFYHYDFKISNIDNYIKKIEQGKFEETIKELKEINRKLTENINDYFRKELLE